MKEDWKHLLNDDELESFLRSAESTLTLAEADVRNAIVRLQELRDEALRRGRLDLTAQFD